MVKKISLFTFVLFFIMSSCSKDENVLELEQENNAIVELSISYEIFNLVNKHRQDLGKSTLIRSSKADELALEHCNFMISAGKISHANFDQRFKELQQNVNASAAGENVAAGYSTAVKVMEAWLESQGHKENIEGNYTHIGIAAIKDSKGNYYFTQLFYR